MLRTRLIAGATSGFVLSAVFATALTLAMFGETFVEPWRVDPERPAPITLRLPRTTLETSDPHSGAHFATVSRVVARGTIVRDGTTAAMVRLYERDRRPPRPGRMAAHFLVYFLLVAAAMTYFRRAKTKQAGLLRTQVALIGLALIFLLADKTLLLVTGLPAHLVPVGFLPLLTAAYLDRSCALLASATMAALASSLVSFDPIVTAVYFMGPAAGSLVVVGRKRGLMLPLAGVLAGVVSAAVYIATKEIFDGFSPQLELARGLRSDASASLMSGVAAGLLAFAAQPLTSLLLGVVSRRQLLNLTDIDQPLLRKIATEAPGSWEHSRAMANLAEAAAASIHADALLTRTGAYYHDLGKTIQPKYFVENLEPGEKSPHGDLDPDVSADAIMAHVVEGVRLLREGRIPEPVVEFAYTHHGTGVIEYFWYACMKAGNPKELSQQAFSYPGMRPRTRETAILMLIDAIEAGARTVDPPSREGFEQLVHRVIFSKLRQGQLDDSGLTQAELRTVANQIIDSLCSIYHSRIRYPWQEQQDESRDEPSEPRPKGGNGNGGGGNETGRHRRRSRESVGRGESESQRLPPVERRSG
ncbi:MAG: HDIG domain-containing protein [Myxococcales bacterium]|nr:HDIG domain-containing protein [Myxococcales bacterium]